MLVNMTRVFNSYKNQCIAAFNVFGYEDAQAVIKAAEDLRRPVILMVNKDALKHMPLIIISGILRELAECSSTQVCIHLDHATDIGTINIAILNGFTSVMYDGSRLSLEDNIYNTNKVINMAHLRDVSVEGEVGSVGYSNNDVCANIDYTDPDEAKVFCEETGVDALAIAIGTVHRMNSQKAVLQFERVDRIKSFVKTPLVIHGSSGIKDKDLVLLVQHGIRKMNFGTCLRQVFGKALRDIIANNDDIFDRITMFQYAMGEVYKEAQNKMSLISQIDK